MQELAIMLGEPHGTRVAQELLARHGSLRRALSAPDASLLTIPGLGHSRLQRLRSLSPLLQSLAAPQGTLIDCTEAAVDHLWGRFATLEVEQFHAMYLSRSGRVLEVCTLTSGTATRTVIDPATVFRPAIILGAPRVLVAHNHPSGDPEPSIEDCRITTRLAQAGTILGVSLVDHLIIAGNRYTSLTARGLC